MTAGLSILAAMLTGVVVGTLLGAPLLEAFDRGAAVAMGLYDRGGARVLLGLRSLLDAVVRAAHTILGGRS